MACNHSHHLSLAEVRFVLEEMRKEMETMEKAGIAKPHATTQLSYFRMTLDKRLTELLGKKQTEVSRG